MDAFIKLLRKRGHNIIIRNNVTYAVVDSIEFKVSVKEKMKHVVGVKTSWGSTVLHPTGLLAIKIDGYHGREWMDRKLPIEQRLANILAKLEIEAEKEKQWRIKLEINRKIREEEERKSKLLQENIDKELENFKDLFKQANRWH